MNDRLGVRIHILLVQRESGKDQEIKWECGVQDIRHDTFGVIACYGPSETGGVDGHRKSEQY